MSPIAVLATAVRSDIIDLVECGVMDPELRSLVRSGLLALVGASRLTGDWEAWDVLCDDVWEMTQGPGGRIAVSIQGLMCWAVEA